MELNEGLGLTSNVILRAYERGLIPWLTAHGFSYDDARCRAAEHIVGSVWSHNIIVTSGKVLVAKMLMDASGYDTGLTYCAIGSDSTTPAVGDTTLATEENRVAVTSKSRTVNAVTYSTFFTAAQSTYAIEEVGLFGHSTASGTTDSGELFNHALLSYDNSAASVDLTIDVAITFG